MVMMQTKKVSSRQSSIDGKISTDSEDISFVQALNQKYVDQEDFDDQFRLPKDRSISTEITYVGFGSVASVQKQLRRLVSIDLSNCYIKVAGNLTEIAGSIDRVSILNLANNRLTWQETIKILYCLPNLKEIILSGNDLKAGESVEFPCEPFKKLISITLGRIDQEWSCIVNVLSRIWTQIDQVDLWDNHLSNDSLKLIGNQTFVSQIKSLGLSLNCFTYIGWISHIGQLSSLIELDLSRCRIECIELDSYAVGQLKNLSLLNISHNNITEWTSLSTLNQLPRLSHLICNDNPITISDKFARAITVARIASLRQLNREEITLAFRRDSEILYLRHTFKAIQENSSCIGLPSDHPRYNDLIELYGIPEDLNAKQAVDKYINVVLYMGDKFLKKKLPCDMRVSNLQMLCKRLFKLKPSENIEIVCHEVAATDDPISYPLDKEGQTLHFFSVKNNHKLVINLLD